MRVAVLGAGGKVGREVVAQVGAGTDLTLAEAISGRDGAALAAAGFAADVLVDFSTPVAVMDLLDRLAGNPLPLVIGTTGFAPDQAARLRAEGARRPILIGANFTLGFEAFRRAGMMLAATLPGAGLTVAETYNAQKKPAASGTTQGLVADLSADGRAVGTEIHRIGDTPGINTLRFDLGVAEISLTLTVASRAAYAAGALAAARWLVGQPNGAYAPADIS
ncbi:dihydrodipicolinate reductase C-terminal domain-containing protein [Pontitalea aquivivens]|uniref:dihydrodipicolinate reductase C-terminal domain-containing protein n=1 Tax=Pontitalea aquivivens TaxID=3388663 RepID=UPI003970B92B